MNLLRSFKAQLATLLFSASLLCLGCLEGKENLSFELPTLIVTPLVKKSHHSKKSTPAKRQLAFISAFGTDNWDTTMFGGNATYPVPCTRSGFNFPVDNIGFIIPQNGSYLIEATFQHMAVFPTSPGNVYFVIQVDGQPAPNGVYELGEDEIVGGNRVPRTVLSRLIPLRKGQQLTILVTSDTGNMLALGPTDFLYPNSSNRSIAIIQVK